MKRLYACILSVTLVLALMIPFASAASVVEYEEYPVEAIDREDIMRMACEAFPEHRENILSFNGNRDGIMALNDTDEIIIYETRQISEYEHLTYIEYASGVSIIGFDKSTYVVSTTSTSKTKTVTVNVYATCNVSQQEFNCSGFKYTIVSDAYDYINSIGSLVGSCSISSKYGSNYEGASGPAYREYIVWFDAIDGVYETLGIRGCSATIRLEVGYDRFNVQVTG